MAIPAEISNLPSETYELIKPIPVTVEHYTDEVLALMPELNLYGEGFNETAALEDLKAEILDLIKDVDKVPNNKLGKNLRIRKKRLRFMVRKSHP